MSPEEQLLNAYNNDNDHCIAPLHVNPGELISTTVRHWPTTNYHHCPP